ncbi:MAG TPA: LacI family DNA-binding transcriptional regulator [Anaerolineaceae bacterium]|nr:LacI family DNA-binding transcriptional regulator [Anaerolineaceae bacterium]
MRSKPITSQDVARRAGVSRATVSLVLNQVESAQISPETAQRVFQAAQELNYVPVAAAQALVSRRSQCIGLVLSRQRHNIGSDVVLNHMIESVLDTLHPAGMRLMIDVVEDFFDHDSYLKLVRSRQVDGIILCGPRFDDEALGRLMDDGFPTVLIGRLPGSPVYSVDIDNVAAAREATAHLISLGRRRIACITNAQPIYAASIDRLEGYRQALEFLDGQCDMRSFRDKGVFATRQLAKRQLTWQRNFRENWGDLTEVDCLAADVEAQVWEIVARGLG